MILLLNIRENEDQQFGLADFQILTHASFLFFELNQDSKPFNSYCCKEMNYFPLIVSIFIYF